MVPKERVLQLEEKDDPNFKTVKLLGYETLEADAAGRSESQTGSQFHDASASGDTKDDIVVE
jgi:hypothetical protein